MNFINKNKDNFEDTEIENTEEKIISKNSRKENLLILNDECYATVAIKK